MRERLHVIGWNSVIDLLSAYSNPSTNRTSWATQYTNWTVFGHILGTVSAELKVKSALATEESRTCNGISNGLAVRNIAADESRIATLATDVFPDV